VVLGSEQSELLFSVAKNIRAHVETTRGCGVTFSNSDSCIPLRSKKFSIQIQVRNFFKFENPTGV